MKIIKLNAIDSTNTYLKEYSKTNSVENYTIVTAENQFSGRGQMGNTWHSEDSKNLVMSMLVKNVLRNSADVFLLNVAVSIAVCEYLKNQKIKNVTIKWPNDIMADSKKIAGILIENTIKSSSEIESVIGIGLNVNQNSFDDLPNATSMKLETNLEYHLDKLLIELATLLIQKTEQLYTTNLWEIYHQNLYKRDTLQTFKNANQEIFEGKIIGVTTNGLLEVLLFDGSIKKFSVKELCFIL